MPLSKNTRDRLQNRKEFASWTRRLPNLATAGKGMDDVPGEDRIHQWLDHDQFPPHLKKYWAQRYQIWERYNRGIWMTESAWFGVTPEPIANKIAAHISESRPPEKTVIIDAFAGVGGNAIAFAREGRWQQVFAIEKDQNAIACAKHNARIYGVEKKIVFINGDCFDVIQKRFSGRSDTVIFASPPWGGPGYVDSDVFNLTTMEPYNMDKLYKGFSKVTSHIVFYLPRTSDLNQLAMYAAEGKKMEVAHYCLKGASKALCVYMGDFTFE